MLGPPVFVLAAGPVSRYEFTKKIKWSAQLQRAVEPPCQGREACATAADLCLLSVHCREKSMRATADLSVCDVPENYVIVSMYAVRV